VQALDAAVRQGKSPHYLSTDFISAQQQQKEKRKSFISKDGSRRGSRESLDSVGDPLLANVDDVSLTNFVVHFRSFKAILF